MEVEYTADSEKFSSSGFCDAYHCMLTWKSTNPNIANHWLIKMYNDKSKEAIGSLCYKNNESHCRKHVEIHEVARHLTTKFKSQAPKGIGDFF